MPIIRSVYIHLLDSRGYNNLSDAFCVYSDLPATRGRRGLSDQAPVCLFLNQSKAFSDLPFIPFPFCKVVLGLFQWLGSSWKIIILVPNLCMITNMIDTGASETTPEALFQRPHTQLPLYDSGEYCLDRNLVSSINPFSPFSTPLVCPAGPGLPYLYLFLIR